MNEYLPETVCQCGAICTGGWAAEFDAEAGTFVPTCTTCQETTK